MEICFWRNVTNFNIKHCIKHNILQHNFYRYKAFYECVYFRYKPFKYFGYFQINTSTRYVRFVYLKKLGE